MATPSAPPRRAGGTWSSGNDAGIVLQSANNTLHNNFVGTDRDGQVAVPNGDGIWVAGGNLNTIGGSAFNQGNLVSGNSGAGVLVSLGASGNQLLGNNIGLTAGQGAALPNDRGVAIEQGDGNDMGAVMGERGNVIAGNTVTGTGVQITGLSNENTVQGNFIGTSGRRNRLRQPGQRRVRRPGRHRQPDRGHGRRRWQRDRKLAATRVSGSRVAGATRGATGCCATASSPTCSWASTWAGTRARTASTPNDANDADTVATRANRGQNFPVITAAVRTGGTTVATGTLDAATAGTQYRIEIYRSGGCDSFGFGEGATFATAVTPTTNGGGDASFSGPGPWRCRRRGAHRHRDGLLGGPQ